MKRRNFIKNTALSAVAISATGFVRFNGNRFEGDCETTTDILGPYYRPDAPLRTDLLIKGAKGQKVVLSGQVFHKDCTTPLKKACIEIWHCDTEGVYDNDSPDFKYRAKAYSDDKGNYSFTTIIPVAYDTGVGFIRPAHFHMMYSAEGYQSLITQLYFTGDKYISKDITASSPSAAKRILDFKNGKNGEKTLAFNVTMMEKIPASLTVIQQLAGLYMIAGGKDQKVEFYKRDNLLWVKDQSSINGGYPLMYNGNNTFASYGPIEETYSFTPQTDGSVKLVYSEVNREKVKVVHEASKSKS